MATNPLHEQNMVESLQIEPIAFEEVSQLEVVL
jgi:hypothetical protein